VRRPGGWLLLDLVCFVLARNWASELNRCEIQMWLLVGSVVPLGLFVGVVPIIKYFGTRAVG
jgi:hypothetical protein